MNGFRQEIGIIAAGCVLSALSMSACLAPHDGLEGIGPRELVLRSVEAYGGRRAVLDFDDLSYECGITVLGDENWISGETRLLFKFPDLLYSSLKLQDGLEKIQCFDGGEYGEWINGRPTGRDIRTDVLRRRRITLIHAFFLEEGGGDAAISGRGEAGGAQCAIVEKRAGGESWKLWIDLEKYLVRKIRLTLPPGDAASGVAGPLSVEWRFEDFKEVDGRQVPHFFKQYLNGELFQQGRIIRFRLNGGLGEEDFMLPAR